MNENVGVYSTIENDVEDLRTDLETLAEAVIDTLDLISQLNALGQADILEKTIDIENFIRGSNS